MASTTTPATERPLFPFGLARASERELAHLLDLNGRRGDTARVTAVKTEIRARGYEIA